MKAVIDWFDDILGYGCAKTEDGKKVFVHKDNFLGEPALEMVVQGTQIEFDKLCSPKSNKGGPKVKPKAKNIRVVAYV